MGNANSAEEFFDPFTSTVEDAFNNAGSTFNNLIDNPSDAFDPSSIEQLFNNMPISQITGGLNNAGSNIQSGAQNAGSNIQSGLQNAGNQIQTGINNGVGAVSNAGNKLIDKAKDTVDKVTDKVKGALGDIGDFLKNPLFIAAGVVVLLIVIK